jgi:hypothetical protein
MAATQDDGAQKRKQSANFLKPLPPLPMSVRDHQEIQQQEIAQRRAGVRFDDREPGRRGGSEKIFDE